jgi:hypothetical protein
VWVTGAFTFHRLKSRPGASKMKKDGVLGLRCDLLPPVASLQEHNSVRKSPLKAVRKPLSDRNWSR